MAQRKRAFRKTFSKPIARPKKVELDGHKFDSQAEANRYGELKLLAMAGHIRDLKVHPRLPMVINGKKLGRGYFICDFYYEKTYDGAWRPVWEDFKRFDTDASRIRRQVCELVNNVQITVRSE